MISNADIRSRARNMLGNDLFKAEWLYPVLVVFILSAIFAAVTTTFVGPIVLIGVLECASAGYFLGRVRKQFEHDKIDVTINSVRNDLSGSMITGILVNLFIGLARILLVVPGIILSCSLSMVYFIRIDHPEMGVMESIKESARLMNGHKMQYFLLTLSFIGWMFIGGLCFGIGTLWVNAYMNSAYAIFYEELLALDGGYYNATAEEA